MHPLQKEVKAIDRLVREKLGGLVVQWAWYGKTRHYHLPEGVSTSFSYKRCTCAKCEWVIGRAPLYPMDIVRNYQRRHRSQVVTPVPPPASCSGDRNILDPILECECPRCEEARNTPLQSFTNTSVFKMTDRSTLSSALQNGSFDCVHVLCSTAVEHRPMHLCFKEPFNFRLYEMLRLPKPAQRWERFGVPRKPQDTDDVTDSEDSSEEFQDDGDIRADGWSEKDEKWLEGEAKGDVKSEDGRVVVREGSTEAEVVEIEESEENEEAGAVTIEDRESGEGGRGEEGVKREGEQESGKREVKEGEGLTGNKSMVIEGLEELEDVELVKADEETEEDEGETEKEEEKKGKREGEAVEVEVEVEVEVVKVEVEVEVEV